MFYAFVALGPDGSECFIPQYSNFMSWARALSPAGQGAGKGPVPGGPQREYKTLLPARNRTLAVQPVSLPNQDLQFSRHQVHLEITVFQDAVL
jgi:hypothetical protein